MLLQELKATSSGLRGMRSATLRGFFPVVAGVVVAVGRLICVTFRLVGGCRELKLPRFETNGKANE